MSRKEVSRKQLVKNKLLVLTDQRIARNCVQPYFLTNFTIYVAINFLRGPQSIWQHTKILLQKCLDVDFRRLHKSQSWQYGKKINRQTIEEQDQNRYLSHFFFIFNFFQIWVFFPEPMQDVQKIPIFF